MKEPSHLEEVFLAHKLSIWRNIEYHRRAKVNSINFCSTSHQQEWSTSWTNSKTSLSARRSKHRSCNIDRIIRDCQTRNHRNRQRTRRRELWLNRSWLQRVKHPSHNLKIPRLRRISASWRKIYWIRKNWLKNFWRRLLHWVKQWKEKVHWCHME